MMILFSRSSSSSSSGISSCGSSSISDINRGTKSSNGGIGLVETVYLLDLSIETEHRTDKALD